MSERKVTGFRFKGTSATKSLKKEMVIDGYLPRREWVIDCLKQLGDARFGVINTPTGSGKSKACKAYIVKKLKKDSKLKAIIAIPELPIAKGFTKPEKLDLGEDGKHHWVIVEGNNLCGKMGSRRKVEEAIKFLKRKVGKHDDIMSRILVCTHSTLLAVEKNLYSTSVPADKLEENLKLSENLCTIIDEAHALQGGDEGDLESGRLPESPNKLGSTILRLVDKDIFCNTHVLLVTATFFRGDRRRLLPRTVLADFERFDMPYDVWLPQMEHLKELTYDFVLGARESADPADYIPVFKEAFRVLIETGHNKVITYIPHRLTPLARHSESKAEELNRLIVGMAEVLGCTIIERGLNVIKLVRKDGFSYTILDLVTEAGRAQRQNNIVHSDVINRDKNAVDCIIALELAKEGFDWVHANGMIINGQKGSAREVLQMIGRLLRDIEGKNSARVMHVLPFNSDSLPTAEFLNRVMTAMAINLLLEEVIVPRMPRGRTTDSTSVPPETDTETETSIWDRLDLDESDEISYSNEILRTMISLRGTLRAETGVMPSDEDLRNRTDETIAEFLLDRGVTIDGTAITREQALEAARVLRERHRARGVADSLDEVPDGWEIIREVPEELRFMLRFMGLPINAESLNRLRDILIRSAQANKDALLEMARSGHPKLSPDHSLYFILKSYTNNSKANKMYDPEFDKLIRELRPDWFEKSSDNKKEILLGMYERGEPRPTSGTLWNALRHYCAPAEHSYDREFCEKIPKWLVSSVEQNITELTKIIEVGGDKPSTKTPLGRAFTMYCDPKNPCYREEFHNYALEKVSDWFESSSEKTKKQLLQMAANGEEKPSQKTTLGMSLQNYISRNSKSYNRDFIDKLREVNPNWLVTQYDKAADKKTKLLEMAKNGEPRPPASGPNATTLGRALVNYTDPKDKTNYDEEFDKEIRTIRPDWFRSKADDAKDMLIEILISGGERPLELRSPDRNKMEDMLGIYHKLFTRKGSDSFDSNYVQLCEKFNPKWLWNKEDEVRVNIDELKDMEAKGEPRPVKGHRLFNILGNYLKKDVGGLKTYFVEKKSLWVKSRDEIVSENINELKRMEARGDPRPSEGHPLCNAYKNYMQKDTCGFKTYLVEKKSTWLGKQK